MYRGSREEGTPERVVTATEAGAGLCHLHLLLLPVPRRDTHLTPLGLFLKFCTSRVSSSFNLKKGNAQTERPSMELRLQGQPLLAPLPRR